MVEQVAAKFSSSSSSTLPDVKNTCLPETPPLQQPTLSPLSPNRDLNGSWNPNKRKTERQDNRSNRPTCCKVDAPPVMPKFQYFNFMEKRCVMPCWRSNSTITRLVMTRHTKQTVSSVENMLDSQATSMTSTAWLAVLNKSRWSRIYLKYSQGTSTSHQETGTSSVHWTFLTI